MAASIHPKVNSFILQHRPGLLDEDTLCSRVYIYTCTCVWLVCTVPIHAGSMAVLPDGQWQVPVPIQLRDSNDPVEVASSFTYLGSVLADDCSLDAEVSARISRASQAFRSLSRLLWYQKRIKSSSKIRIFKAVIIPSFNTLWP